MGIYGTLLWLGEGGMCRGGGAAKTFCLIGVALVHLFVDFELLLFFFFFFMSFAMGLFVCCEMCVVVCSGICSQSLYAYFYEIIDGVFVLELVKHNELFGYLFMRNGCSISYFWATIK